MEVRCRIVRIVIKQNTVFSDSLFQVSLVGVFHREAIAREAVTRVLLDHTLEDFHSISSHISTCYYTEQWPARTFIPWPGSRRSTGCCLRGGLWVIHTAASAA